VALLKRGEVPAPEDLKRQVVTVESLGGDVVVVEMDLGDRLEFDRVLRGPDKDPNAPDDPNAPAEKPRSPRAGVKVLLPHLLAVCVRDADDEPLFTAEQWRAFGAKKKNVAPCIELFNIAFRLSGFDEDENRKNS
jgi:hypothetical protein